jgi:hypothetical protein
MSMTFGPDAKKEYVKDGRPVEYLGKILLIVNSFTDDERDYAENAIPALSVAIEALNKLNELDVTGALGKHDCNVCPKSGDCAEEKLICQLKTAVSV